MLSVTPFSLPENYLVFRKPNKEEIDLRNIAICAISDCSRWNFDPGHSDKSIMNATYPCVEKSDNSIVIHWAILQLMRIYDLTFRGLKVKQDFPKPRYNTDPTTALINAISASNLRYDFDIKEGIKKLLNSSKTSRVSYKKFFIDNRGKDAVAVFNLIIGKHVDRDSHMLPVTVASSILTIPQIVSLDDFEETEMASSSSATPSPANSSSNSSITEIASSRKREFSTSSSSSATPPPAKRLKISSSSSNTEIAASQINMSLSFDSAHTKLLMGASINDTSTTITIDTDKMLGLIPTRLIQAHLFQRTTNS